MIKLKILLSLKLNIALEKRIIICFYVIVVGNFMWINLKFGNIKFVHYVKLYILVHILYIHYIIHTNYIYIECNPGTHILVRNICNSTQTIYINPRLFIKKIYCAIYSFKIKITTRGKGILFYYVVIYISNNYFFNEVWWFVYISHCAFSAKRKNNLLLFSLFPDWESWVIYESPENNLNNGKQFF